MPHWLVGPTLNPSNKRNPIYAWQKTKNLQCIYTKKERLNCETRGEGLDWYTYITTFPDLIHSLRHSSQILTRVCLTPPVGLQIPPLSPHRCYQHQHQHQHLTNLLCSALPPTPFPPSLPPSHSNASVLFYAHLLNHPRTSCPKKSEANARARSLSHTHKSKQPRPPRR